MMGKKISVKELSNASGMTHIIRGVTDNYVTHPAPIYDADTDSVAFCSKEKEDALEIIKNSTAKVIFCSDKLEINAEYYVNKTLILVPNPRLAFIRIMSEYFEHKTAFGIHPTAVIDKDAVIHSKVFIGPYCYISKCEIGEGTFIAGNVHIYPNVMIGKRVIIHAGTVIGSDGFGYERNEVNVPEKFPHIGGVIIEDDVEVGSNTSIDRGTIGDTLIRENTKLDNLVHIGHNAVIGRRCLVAANAMIAGSAKIGDDVWIGPSSSVSNDVVIGDRVFITLGSVVTRNISTGKKVTGNFAIDHDKFIAFLKTIR